MATVGRPVGGLLCRFSFFVFASFIRDLDLVVNLDVNLDPLGFVDVRLFRPKSDIHQIQKRFEGVRRNIMPNPMVVGLDSHGATLLFTFEGDNSKIHGRTL